MTDPRRTPSIAAPPAASLTVWTDPEALSAIDHAVECLDAIHGSLSAGERGPDIAADLLHLAGMLLALGAPHAPSSERGRLAMVWRGLARTVEALEVAA